MKVRTTKLPGVLVIEPRLFTDDRGHFLETFQAERYASHGMTKPFVQDNLSHSCKGVLRGLHYQLGHAQAKLVMVVEGVIQDVAVDIRRGSPTFGQWVAVTLSSDSYQQVFIPEGFAHGFSVLSDTATVIYKCSDYYSPPDERGIIWNDPGLAIEWPVPEPILSEKDALYPTLAEVGPDDLPVFKE